MTTSTKSAGMAVTGGAGAGNRVTRVEGGGGAKGVGREGGGRGARGAGATGVFTPYAPGEEEEVEGAAEGKGKEILFFLEEGTALARALFFVLIGAGAHPGAISDRKGNIFFDRGSGRRRCVRVCKSGLPEHS